MTRLRQSLSQGLDKVEMVLLRGEIWKVLCNVSTFRSNYSNDVFSKFVVGCDPKAEKKIKNDIYRTNPSSEDFT